MTNFKNGYTTNEYAEIVFGTEDGFGCKNTN